eukprot:TRINITY_DN5710_c0_g2_i1.p1 TRINITY_DN5710_c0_g2~~TRINITY_DN5710_c0_g2_i1.p1  ORF type:complete len:709 (-),score=155.63 TRINITY_DN5710_c0_g2_i1:82-2208(-)
MTSHSESLRRTLKDDILEQLVRRNSPIQAAPLPASMTSPRPLQRRASVGSMASSTSPRLVTRLSSSGLLVIDTQGATSSAADSLISAPDSSDRRASMDRSQSPLFERRRSVSSFSQDNASQSGQGTGRRASLSPQPPTTAYTIALQQRPPSPAEEPAPRPNSPRQSLSRPMSPRIRAVQQEESGLQPQRGTPANRRASVSSQSSPQMNPASRRGSVSQSASQYAQPQVQESAFPDDPLAEEVATSPFWQKIGGKLSMSDSARKAASELARLRVENDALTVQLRDSQLHLATMRESATANSKQAKKANEQAEKLRSEKAKAEATVLHLQQRVAQVEKHASETSKQLKDARIERDQLRGQLKASQEVNSEISKRLEEDFSLRDQLATLQREQQLWKKIETSMRSALQRTSSQLATVRSHRETEKRVHVQTSEFLQREVKRLSKQLSSVTQSATRDQATLEGHSSLLQKDMHQLAQRHAEVLADRDDQIQDLRSEIGKYQQMLQTLVSPRPPESPPPNAEEEEEELVRVPLAQPKQRAPSALSSSGAQKSILSSSARSRVSFNEQSDGDSSPIQEDSEAAEYAQELLRKMRSSGERDPPQTAVDAETNDDDTEAKRTFSDYDDYADSDNDSVTSLVQSQLLELQRLMQRTASPKISSPAATAGSPFSGHSQSKQQKPAPLVVPKPYMANLDPLSDDVVPVLVGRRQRTLSA